jgi:hypothetical protein
VRAKLIVVACAGVAVGLVASVLLRQPEVFAQPAAAKTAYEFKVVEFGTGFLNTESADDMGKKLGKLSEEGWEYVGPVANSSDDKRFLQGFVAFRRAKK